MFFVAQELNVGFTHRVVDTPADEWMLKQQCFGVGFLKGELTATNICDLSGREARSKVSQTNVNLVDAAVRAGGLEARYIDPRVSALKR